MRLFSVDAETNGLYGPVFAIAAVVRVSEMQQAEFVGRCEIAEPIDDFVRQEVLPQLTGLAITHSSVGQLEEDFWEFWRAHSRGSIALAHCAYPVEAGLFRRCVERQPLERWNQGPFPLHDVGTILLKTGHDPLQLDAYLARYDQRVPFEGSPHHPLYDANAAAIAWEFDAKQIP